MVIVQGDTYLEFRDLSVEVPCHEALAQQRHTTHLCLDAASAVVSAPSTAQQGIAFLRGGMMA